MFHLVCGVVCGVCVWSGRGSELVHVEGGAVHWGLRSYQITVHIYAAFVLPIWSYGTEWRWLLYGMEVVMVWDGGGIVWNGDGYGMEWR